ncbi:hypothetical protein LguiB_018457 [Lonicera macranthoides]
MYPRPNGLPSKFDPDNDESNVFTSSFSSLSISCISSTRGSSFVWPPSPVSSSSLSMSLSLPSSFIN